MDDRVRCDWKQCAYGLVVVQTEGAGCCMGDPFIKNCDKFTTTEGWEKKMNVSTTNKGGRKMPTARIKNKDKSQIEKEESVFWMVWNEGGSPPMVKHDNFAEAQNEAGRLCAKENTTFYVLEAVEVVEQLPGPVVHKPLRIIEKT